QLSGKPNEVNDTLYAGKGNDILIGGKGDDSLYGGDGVDTAVYAGNFKDYTVTRPVIGAGGSVFFEVTDKQTTAANPYAGEGSMGWKYSQRWLDQHRADIDAIVEHIRAHGPARSADFERKGGKGNGWWDWKPEKRHLEVMFTLGRLMVKERRGFQRVYDLTPSSRPSTKASPISRPSSSRASTAPPPPSLSPSSAPTTSR
ncbi:crosslink repair DNA glycosylase YcaQ family protein, partial [Chromobacterium vaccinii]|uniref:DNA glycosylase AlkZ-like family protein n=1 Tax=Chromobacterium vaccinii TaxID=1108595 RepID=UPI003458AA88